MAGTGKRPRAESPVRAALVWEELPSDAALALETLRPYVLGAFPLCVFPLAVLSGHVGAASTLTLRAELAALAASGAVRELHLLNGEEVVVVSSSDLHAYLREQRAAGSSASSSSGSASSSSGSASSSSGSASSSSGSASSSSSSASSSSVSASSSSASSSAVRGRAFDFFASLLAHHPTSHVSDTDVAVSYRAWLKEEAAAVGRGGGGGGAALQPAGASGAMQRLRAAAGAGAGFGLEQALKELLSLGLLLRHSTPDAASKSYTFGVPGGAQLAQYLKEGREELLARMRKAPGRQLPREHVLTKVRLRSSPFPTLIHLRDALGRGRVAVHHLSDGPYVRWVAT
jgi:hypothetical protein